MPTSTHAWTINNPGTVSYTFGNCQLKSVCDIYKSHGLSGDPYTDFMTKDPIVFRSTASTTWKATYVTNSWGSGVYLKATKPVKGVYPMLIYWHLSKDASTVKDGIVKNGDVLGTVKYPDGMSTGPHVAVGLLEYNAQSKLLNADNGWKGFKDVNFHIDSKL